ncbi:MAG: F0F1 ATP synthase subunit delta [Candidatus Endonucleobacter bathymodioli]|uniref:ATP synthase subunit delta n=1 Tax=Candidatus Endonucleibacter bathymodioli TaxID=539814 RepID=A0AA90SCE1_9GAMM|nr:F0F1 ATP synthase subunit delta [Candidatus Endonucleobacter bathymodioli]
MELTTCARPYARSAFEHAKKIGQLSEWAQMLSLCASVASYDSVNRLLCNPALTSHQQANAFLALCEGSTSREAENFIRVLSENKRIPLLPTIEMMFKQLKDDEECSQDVSIISAFPLADEQLKVIEKKIEARLGRSIKLTTVIGSELIGGVIIKAGDLVIDGSLRARLVKLGEAMIS